MKSSAMRRILSVLLVAVMLLTATGTALAGGDTLAPREGEQGHKGENQPTYHGHRAYDVLNWSPETDEFASFMRAEVPLQERNDAFQATQANPKLEQAVKTLALMEDYGNEFFNPTQYNDDFAQLCFNYWQYLDYYASWHGTVTDPTPDSLYDPEAEWWLRLYEFGVINIPNPAYTNAAHKNGVKSLGCVFFPRAEHTDDWVFQDEDGNFPMADKMVELANYYGFDGYFINAEEGLPASFMDTYQAFCRSLTQQGLYIQVYASNLYGQNNQGSWGSINYYDKTAANFSNWIKKPEDETIAANSLYMNPGPSKAMVDSSVATMEALGMDARETVFMTLEAGQTGFSGVRGSLNELFDENLVPRTAIASLGAATCWAHLDEQVFGHTGHNSYDENRRGDPDYQKYVIARERTWWSGAADQPYYANDSSYVVEGVTFKNKPTTQYTESERQELLKAILDATFDPYATANDPTRAEYDGYSGSHGNFQSWPGMAAFASERSVIRDTNFHTNFNTGHGMQYFLDGRVVNENQWSNMNDQDFLPSWQWWIETSSANRLGMDFDYGKLYNAGYDYTQVGAYKGGSSLAIFGDVDARSDIHLYKTDLDINENSKLNLVYNKPSKTDNSELSMVLYLKDGESTKTVRLPVRNGNRKTNGWVEATIDLSAYAGETIAAFGISVNTKELPIHDYQINLGQIVITDGSATVTDAPSGLIIDRLFETGEAYLRWDLDDYDTVQKYNVYAVAADGTRTHVGGAYADYFYVKDSFYNPDTTVAFAVTAVGADGVESPAASVSCDPKNVSLTVEERAGVLSANWTLPDVAFSSILAEVSLPDNHYGNTNVYTAEFAADATSGLVAVPVADGSRYILRLSFLNEDGNVVTYADHSGMLTDTFCENYKGGLVARTTASGWKLVNPQVHDWWHLYAWKADGTQLTFSDSRTYAIRGQDDLTKMPVSGDSGYIVVQLEDFNGNLSEKTKVYWGLEGMTVDENLFPDPVVLAAVRDQVGETMEEVLAFDGTLDLSGTEVADLTGINLLENLGCLDLSNTKLTTIYGIKTAREINLTGCAALQVLDLSDSVLEKITCEDPAALASIVNVKLDNARLDLSEGTPERAFVDAMIAQTTGKEDIVIVDPELSNQAPNGTTIQGEGTVFDGDRDSYSFLWGSPGTYVLDMGEPATINGWKLVNEAGWGINAFTLSVSDDNETYTDVISCDGLDNVGEKSGTFAEPVVARYFKLYATTGYYGLLRDFELLGHSTVVYTAGVSAGNQRPVAYVSVPEAGMIEVADSTLDLTAVPTFTTVRGSSLETLRGADFLADDYDIDAQLTGCDVIYVDGVAMDEMPIDETGTYEVSYVTFGVENDVKEMTVEVYGCPSGHFTDVDTSRWYHESVDLMVMTGLMQGTSDTTFEPYGNVTRKQMVTILYRMAGSPKVDEKQIFSDVPTGRYYSEAVTWASENGIAMGHSDGTFRPDELVTRQDMVCFLYRFANAQAVEEDVLSSFADAGTVSAYAAEAMNWAVANDLVQGVKSADGNHLMPRIVGTRAVVATVIARYEGI